MSEQWTEMKSGAEGTCEALMEQCSCCGQPRERYRVLRMEPEEVKRWVDLENARGRSLMWGLPSAMVAAIVLGIVVAYCAASAGAFIFSALGTYFVIAILFISYANREGKKIDTIQKGILARYGTYELKEVGLGERRDWGKKYVILSSVQKI